MGSRTQYRRKATAVVSYAPPSESDDSVEEPCAGSCTTFSNKPQKGTREAPPDEQVDSSDAAAESSGDDFRPGQALKKKTKKKRRPHKKAKHAAKAVTAAGPAVEQDGCDGKLEGIKLVPMEVFLDILSKSSPGELLSLSQVSQGYRSIVTGDNSEALWRQARANYQLPDITSGGFTELHYAGLFFGKGCAACDSNGGAPDFYLRVKLCRTCRHAR
ncbi:hypothetical protein BMF94_0650 [Rhodotorula taiwanensis]|uniref:F-box domain-containing protein n=1 Tax=Rhodotorula taiwanensis TaxID=741276 RepID=A0A2S5BI41_9BASI|nr:hypothetical protein BMF94_0650 [Rhodotorula taiwanensis]